ncbi:hypothetical protein Barb4_02249 [Bacteroidales bacterium Barb4]|nr:hypothetical protein Barb4_02249 [Bacteroidales bacterium Barb4]
MNGVGTVVREKVVRVDKTNFYLSFPDVGAIDPRNSIDGVAVSEYQGTSKSG